MQSVEQNAINQLLIALILERKISQRELSSWLLSPTPVTERVGLLSKLTKELSETNWRKSQMEIELALQHKFRLISILSDDYPNSLKAIPDPPLILFVKGELNLRRKIAIVGARKSSHYGESTAFRLAREITLAGNDVVSGLAYGIDKAAHRGAIESCVGDLTVNLSAGIAVLGSGLLQIYPQAHLELVEKILSNNGAIVSEYFCKATPRPINFLQRNRIISGLSDGIVVVEAASRSGALVTARFGLEQGRVVFAMPGPVDSELSEGTNQLIRDGAILTRHYEDICEEILELNKIGEKKFDKDLSLKFESYLDKSNFDHDTREKVKTLWNLFSRESTLQYDLLIERLCLAPRELNAILSSLELADLVKALDGGIYAKS